MDPTNFRTLYAWPFRKEKPTIEPSNFWRSPISGRVYPVYKRSECTEMFLVPIQPWQLTEGNYEYESDLEEFVILRIAEKKNLNDKLQSAEEKPSSSKEPPSNEMKDGTEHNLEANSEANGPLRIKKMGWCKFCKSNGERPEFFLTHNLTSEKDCKITCPVLRQFTCPICNATGDYAHTVRYCPLRTQKEQRIDRNVFPRFARSATGQIKICRH